MFVFNFQIYISGFSTEATLTGKESKDRGEIFKVSFIRAKITRILVIWLDAITYFHAACL